MGCDIHTFIEIYNKSSGKWVIHQVGGYIKSYQDKNGIHQE